MQVHPPPGYRSPLLTSSAVHSVLLEYAALHPCFCTLTPHALRTCSTKRMLHRPCMRMALPSACCNPDARHSGISPAAQDEGSFPSKLHVPQVLETLGGWVSSIIESNHSKQTLTSHPDCCITDPPCQLQNVERLAQTKPVKAVKHVKTVEAVEAGKADCSISFCCCCCCCCPAGFRLHRRTSSGWPRPNRSNMSKQSKRPKQSKQTVPSYAAAAGAPLTSAPTAGRRASGPDPPLRAETHIRPGLRLGGWLLRR